MLDQGRGLFCTECVQLGCNKLQQAEAAPPTPRLRLGTRITYAVRTLQQPEQFLGAVAHIDALVLAWGRGASRHSGRTAVLHRCGWQLRYPSAVCETHTTPHPSHPSGCTSTVPPAAAPHCPGWLEPQTMGDWEDGGSDCNISKRGSLRVNQCRAHHPHL